MQEKGPGSAGTVSGAPRPIKLRKLKRFHLTDSDLRQVLSEDESFRSRIALDEIRSRILIDGEVATDSALTRLANEILEKYSTGSLSHESFCRMVQAVARENSFNVVRNYLRALPEWDGVPRLRDIPRIFGLSPDDPGYSLYGRYCECFFIGAVARALRPGCKNDAVLVLTGPQYIGKSTFFAEMAAAAGPSLFYDGLCNIGKRDDLMVMNSYWILEWAEIDELIQRSASGRVKAFLSAREDAYRAPYARLVEQHPRHFALAATTNESVFLRDPTGSRRFYCIPCTEVDMTKAKAERDKWWTEAYASFLAEKPWWLSDAEAAEQREKNSESEIEPTRAILEELLGDAVGHETWTIDASESHRMYVETIRDHGIPRNDAEYSMVMHSLGFRSKRKQIGGVWKRFWSRQVKR